MEQTATTFSEKPLIISDVCLMAPGVWTGTDNRPTEFTLEQIKRGYLNTSWDSMNLYLDHRDGDMSGLAYWAGLVKNPYLKENGYLHGDVEIWHPLMKVAFKEAKANIAVSATTNGLVERVEDGVDKYRLDSYRSFSLVDSPGCKISWLPKKFSRKEGDLTVDCGEITEENLKSLSGEKEFAKVTNMEELRKQKGMSVSEFYAVPRDPPSSSSLPIFDEAHVRNALARFNQTSFDNPSQKKTAWNKIVKAANKFGIKVTKEFSDYTQENDSNLESSEEVSSSEKHSEKDTNKKEVNEMSEQKDTAEGKALSESKEEMSNEVKELSSKVDQLSKDFVSISEQIKSLTGIVQKSLAEGEESEEEKEESSEEAEEKEENSDEEESEEEKELAKTKKELAELKAKVKASEVKSKEFASGVNENVDVDRGMMNVLRHMHGYA